MKNKINACFLAFLVAVVFSSCATTRRSDFSVAAFSLKNTLSVFLLDNGKDSFFCIPVQYLGDYQIGNFEFTGGYIRIGDYEILLNRNEINISVYLDEEADDDGSSDGNFNMVHSEENGRIVVAKMGEPLRAKNEPDGKLNHYYIFIERFLGDEEGKKIIDEYEKGNVYSQLYIGFDITIDDELQGGSGMYDDFELYNGPALDPSWFPPNLNFFRARYLEK